LTKNRSLNGIHFKAVMDGLKAVPFKEFGFFRNHWKQPGRRIMRREDLTIVLLSIIAIALVAIAVQPIFAPHTAEAQSSVYPFYIEPGSEMLRSPDGRSQVFGKVVVDMRTGKIWGFPTNAPQSYPSNGLQNKPPVSRPFELGKFAFEDTNE
jgi:hypothetical protein